MIFALQCPYKDDGNAAGKNKSKTANQEILVTDHQNESAISKTIHTVLRSVFTLMCHCFASIFFSSKRSGCIHSAVVAFFSEIPCGVK